MKEMSLAGLNPNLTDGTINLVRLTSDKVTKEYVGWLNDSRVNEFLECRHSVHTINSVKTYVEELSQENSSEMLFGIYIQEHKKHIGNIKIGPVNWLHRHATIGLMIGDTEFWGKGFGSRSIQLLSEFASNQLGLLSLNAGCYEANQGSFKAFLKAGWESAGRIKSHWIDRDGKRNDELIMSYSPRFRISIPATGGITLIGGGDLLQRTALHLRKSCLDVAVVLAPRHRSLLLEKAIEQSGCEILVSNNLNRDIPLLENLKKYSRFCLCFGPAWVFKSQLLSIYSGRIFNYNGIPIPDYLGGAHYTWQILNQSFTGGAFIQQITQNVDRGPIALSDVYELPPSLKVPAEYEFFNNQRGWSLIQRFLSTCLLESRSLEFSEFQPDWTHLTYYPRLLTSQSAWIDWSWSGEEIERFCNAFDLPYSGAQTTFNGSNIALRRVHLEKGSNHHPFCSGLIVRSSTSSKSVWVAVRSGLLRVDEIQALVNNEPVSLKLGDRLITSASNLEKALTRITFDSNGAQPK